MSKIEDLISTFAFCFTNNKMKHIVDRKNQCRVWGMLFCLFLLCVSVSCQRDGGNLYNDVNDVADKRLAVYKGALTDSLTKNVFPLADIKNYEKTSKSTFLVVSYTCRNHHFCVGNDFCIY